ncbi:MAG: DUF2852 domain-containing protein [Proteobacteria bacterium]|nr:DUF2852 domain-containing protein [Pseudomonadota bacterium]
MFHLHHLIFLPFFVLFHVVGLLFLGFAALVVMKAFRRRRCRAEGAPEAKVRARSGNEAFDDYRRATLRKLEAEAEEFRKYLDGLRRAADAAAFEAFLKSRRADNGPVT